MEPWGIPLVIGHQPDVTPFTTTLRACPINQMFAYHVMILSSSMLDILSRRTLRETSLTALLNQLVSFGLHPLELVRSLEA